jgi:uncharacterized protein YjbI with pentapeptide repeats
MTPEEIKQVLDLHREYLENEAGGEYADLRGANLRGANLRGANLRSADLQKTIFEGMKL